MQRDLGMKELKKAHGPNWVQIQIQHMSVHDIPYLHCRLMQ